MTKNLLMGGVAACAVVLASCGEKTDSAVADVSAVGQGEAVSLSLKGLSCVEGCGSKVKSALSKIDGVVVESVSVTAAKLAVDRSKVTDDALVKAVTDAGFEATVD